MMKYKDRNCGGLTPGGGSGWPGSLSGVGELLPFLLFAILSPMFGLLFRVTLGLIGSKNWLILIVCYELNNLEVMTGPETSPVGRDRSHNLGI